MSYGISVAGYETHALVPHTVFTKRIVDLSTVDIQFTGATVDVNVEAVGNNIKATREDVQGRVDLASHTINMTYEIVRRTPNGIHTTTYGRRWQRASYTLSWRMIKGWGNKRIALVPAVASVCVTIPDRNLVAATSAFAALYHTNVTTSEFGATARNILTRYANDSYNCAAFCWRLAMMYIRAAMSDTGCYPRDHTGTAEYCVVPNLAAFVGILPTVHARDVVPYIVRIGMVAEMDYIGVLLAASAKAFGRSSKHLPTVLKCPPPLRNPLVVIFGAAGSVYELTDISASTVWGVAQMWCTQYNCRDEFMEALTTISQHVFTPRAHRAGMYMSRAVMHVLPASNMSALILGPAMASYTAWENGDYTMAAPSIKELLFEGVLTTAHMNAAVMRVLADYGAWHLTMPILSARAGRTYMPSLWGNGTASVPILIAAAKVVNAFDQHFVLGRLSSRIIQPDLCSHASPKALTVYYKDQSPFVQWEELFPWTGKVVKGSVLHNELQPMQTTAIPLLNRWYWTNMLPSGRTVGDWACRLMSINDVDVAYMATDVSLGTNVIHHIPPQALSYRGQSSEYTVFNDVAMQDTKYRVVFRVRSAASAVVLSTLAAQEASYEYYISGMSVAIDATDYDENGDVTALSRMPRDGDGSDSSGDSESDESESSMSPPHSPRGGDGDGIDVGDLPEPVLERFMASAASSPGSLGGTRTHINNFGAPATEYKPRVLGTVPSEEMLITHSDASVAFPVVKHTREDKATLRHGAQVAHGKRVYIEQPKGKVRPDDATDAQALNEALSNLVPRDKSERSSLAKVLYKCQRDNVRVPGELLSMFKGCPGHVALLRALQLGGALLPVDVVNAVSGLLSTGLSDIITHEDESVLINSRGRHVEVLARQRPDDVLIPVPRTERSDAAKAMSNIMSAASNHIVSTSQARDFNVDAEAWKTLAQGLGRDGIMYTKDLAEALGTRNTGGLDIDDTRIAQLVASGEDVGIMVRSAIIRARDKDRQRDRAKAWAQGSRRRKHGAPLLSTEKPRADVKAMLRAEISKVESESHDDAQEQQFIQLRDTLRDAGVDFDSALAMNDGWLPPVVVEYYKQQGVDTSAMQEPALDGIEAGEFEKSLIHADSTDTHIVSKDTGETLSSMRDTAMTHSAEHADQCDTKQEQVDTRQQGFGHDGANTSSSVGMHVSTSPDNTPDGTQIGGGISWTE